MDSGITLVKVSNDCFIDGQARQPSREGNLPSRQTAYGRGSLVGEHAVLELLGERHSLFFLSEQPHKIASHRSKLQWLYAGG
jgi:dTDP-4-dehydrorhamnose reductase